MKILLPFILITTLLFSCGQNKNTNNQQNESLIEEEKKSFFPVHSFLKGQFTDIRNSGKYPIMKIMVKNHTDSSWVKPDSLENVFSDFITPPIDSVSIGKYFSEHKFIDQSINLLTMVYDPVGQTPADIPWRNWIVYIDPATGTVKKIYLVKELGNDRVLQLTWMADKFCKILTINEKPVQGHSPIEKETTIHWDY